MAESLESRVTAALAAIHNPRLENDILSAGMIHVRAARSISPQVAPMVSLVRVPQRIVSSSARALWLSRARSSVVKAGIS